MCRIILQCMVMSLFICLLTCSSQVSAFQCNIQFSFLGCMEGVPKMKLLEEWQFNLTEKQLSEFEHDRLFCNCARKAEKLKYEHIALIKTVSNMIRCYAVRFVGRTELLRTSNEAHQSKCENAYPTEEHGHVLVGTEQSSSAVHHVTPSSVTLDDKTTTSAPKTIILLTTTTRRPLIEPPPFPPPEEEENDQLHDFY